MRDKVALLDRHQVWDTAKGCFFVKLRPLKKKRYQGWPVYEDAFGKRIAIREVVPV